MALQFLLFFLLLNGVSGYRCPALWTLYTTSSAAKCVRYFDDQGVKWYAQAKAYCGSLSTSGNCGNAHVPNLSGMPTDYLSFLTNLAPAAWLESGANETWNACSVTHHTTTSCTIGRAVICECTILTDSDTLRLYAPLTRRHGFHAISSTSGISGSAVSGNVSSREDGPLVSLSSGNAHFLLSNGSIQFNTSTADISNTPSFAFYLHFKYFDQSVDAPPETLIAYEGSPSPFQVLFEPSNGVVTVKSGSTVTLSTPAACVNQGTWNFLYVITDGTPSSAVTISTHDNGLCASFSAVELSLNETSSGIFYIGQMPQYQRIGVSNLALFTTSAIQDNTTVQNLLDMMASTLKPAGETKPSVLTSLYNMELDNNYRFFWPLNGYFRLNDVISGFNSTTTAINSEAIRLALGPDELANSSYSFNGSGSLTFGQYSDNVYHSFFAYSGMSISCLLWVETVTANGKLILEFVDPTGSPVVQVRAKMFGVLEVYVGTNANEYAFTNCVPLKQWTFLTITFDNNLLRVITDSKICSSSLAYPDAISIPTGPWAMNSYKLSIGGSSVNSSIEGFQGRLACLSLQTLTITSLDTAASMAHKCKTMLASTADPRNGTLDLYKPRQLIGFWPLGRLHGTRDLSTATTTSFGAVALGTSVTSGPQGYGFSATRFQGFNGSRIELTNAEWNELFRGVRDTLTFSFYIKWRPVLFRSNETSFESILSYRTSLNADLSLAVNTVSETYIVLINGNEMNIVSNCQVANFTWRHLTFQIFQSPVQRLRLFSNNELCFDEFVGFQTVAPTDLVTLGDNAVRVGESPFRGALSCFTIYHGFFDVVDSQMTQDMCDTIIALAYKNYALSIPEPSSVIGFWPLSKSLGCTDLSGHDLHLRPYSTSIKAAFKAGPVSGTLALSRSQGLSIIPMTYILKDIPSLLNVKDFINTAPSMSFTVIAYIHPGQTANSSWHDMVLGATNLESNSAYDSYWIATRLDPVTNVIHVRVIIRDFYGTAYGKILSCAVNNTKTVNKPAWQTIKFSVDADARNASLWINQTACDWATVNDSLSSFSNWLVQPIEQLHVGGFVANSKLRIACVAIYQGTSLLDNDNVTTACENLALNPSYMQSAGIGANDLSFEDIKPVALWPMGGYSDYILNTRSAGHAIRNEKAVLPVAGIWPLADDSSNNNKAALDFSENSTQPSYFIVRRDYSKTLATCPGLSMIPRSHAFQVLARPSDYNARADSQSVTAMLFSSNPLANVSVYNDIGVFFKYLDRDNCWAGAYLPNSSDTGAIKFTKSFTSGLDCVNSTAFSLFASIDYISTIMRIGLSPADGNLLPPSWSGNRLSSQPTCQPGGDLTFGGPFVPPIPESSLSLEQTLPFNGSMSCVRLFHRPLTSTYEAFLANIYCSHPAYVGCYRRNLHGRFDSPEFTFMPGIVVPSESPLDDAPIEECRRQCGTYKYRFAATQSNSSSFCACSNHVGIREPESTTACLEAEPNVLSVFRSHLDYVPTSNKVSRISALACPPGWAMATTYQYPATCVTIPAQVMTFQDAEAHCQVIGGTQSHLFVTESSGEEAKLKVLFESLSPSSTEICMGILVNTTDRRFGVRTDKKLLIFHAFDLTTPAVDGAWACASTAAPATGWTYRSPDTPRNFACQLSATRHIYGDNCPVNYTRLENYCYSFRSTVVSYLDARNDCQGDTADLVVPGESLYKTIQLAKLTSLEHSFWIGGSMDLDGFSWANGDAFNVHEAPWAPDTPRPSNKTACIYADASSMYTWRAGDCNLNLAYICQWPAKVTNMALGMTTGRIADRQITTSAPVVAFQTTNKPESARLYNALDAWCPLANGGVLPAHLQVDLEANYQVRLIRILGFNDTSTNGLSGYVDTIQIRYGDSPDVTNSFSVTDIVSPVDSTTSIWQISTNMQTRFIRIIVTSGKRDACMQVEFYGYPLSLDPPPVPSTVRAFVPLDIELTRNSGLAYTFSAEYYTHTAVRPLPAPEYAHYEKNNLNSGATWLHPTVIGKQSVVFVGSSIDPRPGLDDGIYNFISSTPTRKVEIDGCEPDATVGYFNWCTARVIGGSHVNVTLTYGSEATGSMSFTAQVTSSGLSHTQADEALCSDIISANSSTIYAAFPDMFMQNTTIYGVQLLFSNIGLAHLQIYEPTCTDANTVFCFTSYSCLPVDQDCSKQRPFDAYQCPPGFVKVPEKSTCRESNGTLWRAPFPLSDLSRLAGISYQLVANYTPVIGTNYGQNVFYFKDSEIIEVKQGSFWALHLPEGTATEISAACRENDSTEEAIKAYQLLLTDFASTSSIVPGETWTPVHYRALIRFVGVESKRFSFGRMWRKAGSNVVTKISVVDRFWPTNTFTLNYTTPLVKDLYPIINRSVAFSTETRYIFVPTEKTVNFIGDGERTDLHARKEYCWKVNGTWLSDGNCSKDVPFTQAVSGSHTFTITFKEESATPCGSRLDICGIPVVGISRDSETTKTINFYIIALDPVPEGIQIENNGPFAAFSEYTISLTYTALPSDPCILVDLGEASNVVSPYKSKSAFGSEYMCSIMTNYNQDVMSSWKPLASLFNKTLIITTMFKEMGIYPGTVSIFNTISSQVFNMSLVVTKGPCIHPRVTINFGYPTQMVAQRFRMPAMVMMNCTTFDRMDVLWTIWYRNTSLTRGGDDYINVTDTYLSPSEYSNPSFAGMIANPVWQELEINIAPGRLAFGHYRVVLTVTMSESSILTGSDTAEFTVEPMALYAAFSPGLFYGIEFPHYFTIDAYSLSYDPDVVSNSPNEGIDVYYFCRKDCEPEWPALQSLSDAQQFINGTHNWITSLKGVPNPNCVPDAINMGVNYDWPGCFIKKFHSNFPLLDGNEKSVTFLNTQTAKMETALLYKTLPGAKTINMTSAWMFEKERYHLLAIAVKGDKFTTTRQTIDLDLGEPPVVAIKRRTNCATPFREAFMMSATSRASFLGNVLNKVPSRAYSFSWKVIELPGDITLDYALDNLDKVAAAYSWSDEYLARLCSTDVTSEDLSINSHALDSDRYYGKTLLIRLNVQRAGDSRMGTSLLPVIVNRPPSASKVSCKVWPERGTELTTFFSAKCTGFTSQVFGFVVQYSFSAYSCSTCSAKSLTSTIGSPELQRVVLMAGTVDEDYRVILSVTAYDAIGSKTSFNFSVTVEPLESSLRTEAANRYSSFASSVAKMSGPALDQTILTFANFLNSENVVQAFTQSTDQTYYDDTDLMMYRVNISRWLLGRQPQRDPNELQVYCEAVSALTDEVDGEVHHLAMDELEDNMIAISTKVVDLLNNLVQKAQVHADTLEKATSSCSGFVGNLAAILGYHSLKATNVTEARTAEANERRKKDISKPIVLAERPIRIEQSVVNSVIFNRSKQVVAIVDAFAEIVLRRKVQNEDPSYFGSDNLLIAVSANSVSHLENTKVKTSKSDDCESGFQIDNSREMFSNQVAEMYRSRGIYNVSDDIIDKETLTAKAISQKGNPYAKKAFSANSRLQTLVIANTSGFEVKVSQLEHYMELHIPTITDQDPESKLLKAMTSLPIERYKIKKATATLKIDSAFFVNVKRFTPDLKTICSNDTLSSNVRYGQYSCEGGTEITEEEVVYIIYVMDGHEASIVQMANCSLPKNRIHELYKETTSPSATPTAAKTLFSKDTSSSSNCGVKRDVDIDTCFFPMSQVNRVFANTSATEMAVKLGIRAYTVSEIKLGIEELIAAGGISSNGSTPTDEVVIKLAESLSHNRSVRVGFSLSRYSSSCQFWDAKAKSWSTQGCYPGPNCNPSGKQAMAQCFCNHLTSFASNFDVPMNTFDPADSAFTKLDENPICFTFGICIICIYLTLLIWARKKDFEDQKFWGTAPLADNDPRDKYAYEMTVWTGFRSKSGTTANVSFILQGDEGQTFPRRLSDDERPVLCRSNVDSFLLLTPRSLGKINQLHIWHDNAGSSPSWYLLRVMVHDLQRGRQYYFLCDQWLAVDEGDGTVERVLPIASKGELASFQHLFFKRSRRQMTDNHLWISVLARPPLSSFTRCQRLTCCLSLLYCTMLANIMFYGQNLEQPGSPTVHLGPLSMSFTKILASMISVVIVLPVNLIIVQLFRMSRHRLTSKERKMEKFRDKVKQAYIADASKLAISKSQESIPKTKKRKMKNKKAKKFRLPWWCTIVAYILAACTCAVAFWAIVEFGGALGPERAEQWVVSMLISLVTDVLLLQPIKILILVIIYAVIIRKPTNDDDLAERMALQEDELYINHVPTEAEMMKKREEKPLGSDYVLMPPSVEELKMARERMLKERRMWSVLKEFTFAIIFVYLLMLVAYGNQDDWSMTLQKHARHTFLGAKVATGEKGAGGAEIVRIGDGSEMFSLLEKRVLPSLMNSTWYNGEYSSTSDVFTSDQVLYMVGSLRLRQLRITTSACRVAKSARDVYTKSCLDQYSIIEEERRNFTANWELAPTSNDTTDGAGNYVTMGDPEGWAYTSAIEDRSLPFSGWLTWYNGGGYIVDLGQSDLENAQKILKRLSSNRWIDSQTRAIFIEFNLYCPNRNLFALSQSVFEFFAGGGGILYPSLHITRLDPYIGVTAYVVLAFEIITLIVVIIALVREVRLLSKLHKKYWHDWWAVLEFVHLLACLVVGVLFCIRHAISRLYIGSNYQDSNKNTYTNFNLFIVYDQLVQGFVAIIIFVAFMKIIRLLRFNRRVVITLMTLRYTRGAILSFFAVIFIVFMAFGQLGYFTLGSQLVSFSTFITSLETLFSLMLNVFDYKSIVSANPIIGSFLFSAFSVTMNILLLNMFIALLIVAYEDVRLDQTKIGNDADMIDFVIDKMKMFIGLSRRSASLSLDKRFAYIDSAMHEDEIEKFTLRMDQLMKKLDTHVEKTKSHFSSLFDPNILNRQQRAVYVTE